MPIPRPDFAWAPTRLQRALAGLAIGILSGLTGCGERFEMTDADTLADSADGGIGAPTPARYVTTVLFVGAAREPSRLYARFTNHTSETSLARDYGAWLSSTDGWSRLVTVRDTLPLPRADWRILPGPELTVLVGDGAEFFGLGFSSEPPRRLLPGGVIADWTGLTGQRAWLGLGALEAGSELEEGLMFFRRAARPASAPQSSQMDRILLLADSLGNGLLIEGNISLASSPVTIWAWLEGVESSWSDVSFEPAAGDDEPEAAAAATWTFEIPSVGIIGRIRGIDTPGGSGLDTDGRERVYPLLAELALNDRVFRFTGIGLESPLP